MIGSFSIKGVSINSVSKQEEFLFLSICLGVLQGLLVVFIGL